MRPLSDHIVLIGFMGTGKTRVGRLLARKLKRHAVDIDRRIEKAEGRRIHEIFEQDGEAYFRRLEKAMVHEAVKRPGAVITTGGGVVLDPDNMDALRKNGWIVTLTASPETVYERIRNSECRPLLKSENPLVRIRQLMEERRPLYEKADFFVETDGRDCQEVAELIRQAYQRQAGASEKRRVHRT